MKPTPQPLRPPKPPKPLRPLKPLLNEVYGPHDVRALEPARLRRLAADIRASISSSPGVGPDADTTVELGIALHRVFNSARDPVVWDRHPHSFSHELLGGRPELPKRDGPGSPDGPDTSLGVQALSYAEGIARALLLGGHTDRHAVAVVDAQTLATHPAQEALDSLARSPGLRIVVVVVNGRGGPYRSAWSGLTGLIGGALRHTPLVGTLHATLAGPGLDHTPPVDGSSPAELEAALRAAKNAGRPVLVHSVTPVPRGAGATAGPPDGPTARSWASVLAEELATAGAERPDLVAVGSSGRLPYVFGSFAEVYPERAIAATGGPEHAVYCAAGLATEGLHPVVRAHNGPPRHSAARGDGVTFVVDGEASPCRPAPGVHYAAPRDRARLRALLREALDVADAPTVVCLPQGAVGPDIEAVAHDRGIDVLRRVPPPQAPDVLLVSVGAMAALCLEAARLLDDQGVAATVVDPGWTTPAPARLAELTAEHALSVSVADSALRFSGIEIDSETYSETYSADAAGGAPLTAASVAKSVVLRLGELHDACG